MARGFLGGIVIGGLFSVAVAGVVSFVVPMGPPPVADDTPPQDLTSEPQMSMQPDTPVAQADEVETSAPAPLETAQERDAGADVDGVRLPLQAPEIAQDVQITPPADVATSAAPEISGDAPVYPNPMALAPMAPAEQDALPVETAPTEPAPTTDAVAPAAEPEVAVIEQTPVEETEEAPVEAPSIEAGPLADETPDLADAPEENTAVPEESTAPRAIALPDRDADDGRPSIGTPAAIAADRNTGVTVNRLPTTASSANAETPSAPSAQAAIKQFGQPFANPDDKPLMSVLLIDEGSDLDGGEVGIAALRSFPYPISVAVDMSLADAAERMTIYRNEGFEVMAIVDLPEGAQPADAETTLGVAFTRMPEIVGVLEGQGAGLQPDREVADQVTAILGQGGFGLVTQDKGLNTMPKLAVKEGVPAAPIFRDFDSKGQTATVIRRFLDQAAFKAGIEGSVIMLGRMRPETISALLVWGLQDRASQVALAPISAVLLAATGE